MSASVPHHLLRETSDMHRRPAMWVVLAALVLTSGCVTIAEPWPEPGPREPFALAPGDTIEVRAPLWPDLEERATEQVVRPDGKISMQLLGEIRAEGLTPGELAEEMATRYKKWMKDPTVTVLVLSVERQHVHVGGEVRRPGRIALNGKMTPLQAILEAGGPINLSANQKKVYVIRHIDGKRYAKRLNLAKPAAADEGPPLYLAPQDIVFVSRRKIDVVNQWVDQYIRRMLPISVSAASAGGGA